MDGGEGTAKAEGVDSAVVKEASEEVKEVPKEATEEAAEDSCRNKAIWDLSLRRDLNPTSCRTFLKRVPLGY